MFTNRYRFMVRVLLAIVAIWLAAMAGHWWLESRKITAEKVRTYAQSVDFGRLTGVDRARALKELADELNALSFDERRRLRGEQWMRAWFANMTEEEKARFIEATMPTGFKQMIGAFEQMPEDKRRRAIDDALKNLQAQSQPGAANRGARNSAAPPPISPELEAQIRNIGLNTFYSQSSAQTKAEMAPLLEEIQRQMESGRMSRR